MPINKIWLNEKINESLERQRRFEENKDYDRALIEQGKSVAYTESLKKLTETPEPKKTIEGKSDFDPDKTFEEIVRYYIDVKKFTKEHANEIAMKVVSDQKQKRLESNLS